MSKEIREALVDVGDKLVAKQHNMLDELIANNIGSGFYTGAMTGLQSALNIIFDKLRELDKKEGE